MIWRTVSVVVQWKKKARQQWMSCLLFYLLHRKFGSITDRLCQLISYERISRIVEWLSYKL